MRGLSDPDRPKGDGASFVRIGKGPKEGPSGSGIPEARSKSGMFERAELIPEEESPRGLRARSEPLANPMLKSEDGAVTGASSDDSTRR